MFDTKRLSGEKLNVSQIRNIKIPLYDRSEESYLLGYERGNVIESYKLTIRRVTAIDWVHDTQGSFFWIKITSLAIAVCIA